MNGRITEHIFYSLAPKLTPQAAQRIGEAGSCFLSVPGLNPESSYPGFLPEIPQPHNRIKSQAQRCCSFGSPAFVGLRLLATEKLFGIFESILYGPSVVVAFQNFFGCHRQVGGKKEIVSFFSGWVPAYHKQYRLMTNPIPYYLTGINQSLYHSAPLAKLYKFPILNIRSHLLRTGKAFAFLARSASGFLSFLGRQIENLCIALYSRYQMCFGLLLSSQSCVKTVRNQPKSSLGQPLVDLVYHLHCKFYQCIAILPVQSHVYWQPQWLAAPGRLNLQRQNHKVQSPGIDNVLLCRTNCIPPVSGTVDLPAAVMEQSVVQSNSDNTCWAKEFDKHQCQDLPEIVDVPTTIRKKAMVGIVSTLKAWIGKLKDAGYRLSSCTQNPAGHQMRENLCTWSRKNWKKLLNYVRPCRNNCMHIDLPVFLLNLLKTSAGRYVFVYKPLKFVT
jgi:hypothetical protein